jgi:hypothetical protein
MTSEPSFLPALVRFLVEQIKSRQIEFLVPLESKGALLTDLALANFPSTEIRPIVLYLRSLEYLPVQIRKTARFGVFDDFLFTGRTLKRTLDQMRELGIPRENIHAMAFFNLARCGRGEGILADILLSTSVPEDGSLMNLPRDEILREVQLLAVRHKVPASYDNLDWTLRLSESEYSELMYKLAETGNFLFYGQRGHLEASALLLPAPATECFSSPPKLRFWYERATLLLHVTTISFPGKNWKAYGRRGSGLEDLLMPDGARPKQRAFARFQARALSHQVELLGFLKPLLGENKHSLRLSRKNVERYFGPRASLVTRYLEETYRTMPDAQLPPPKELQRELLDFYWVAVEIMRALGRAFWSQPPPRKNSRGYTVTELVERFAMNSSLEAVHAAVDYCADMNFIATFCGWEGGVPYRAFRLTENGEGQVGRNDSVQRPALTFIEKVGALILSKMQNSTAYGWTLEKIPAILERRFGLQFPQFRVAMNYFGDTTMLYPREDSREPLTWPKLDTRMWTVKKKNARSVAGESKVFVLSQEHYALARDEIESDPEIVKLMAPLETIIEFIRSKTKGHHVAILLDILSDKAGGTTYLANSLEHSVEIIGTRGHMALLADRKEASKRIGNWLKGMDEKCLVLVHRKAKLWKHVNATKERMSRQKRGDLANRLMRMTPMAEGNRIIPAFRELASIVAELNKATWYNTPAEVSEIARRLVCPGTLTENAAPDSLGFDEAARAVIRWSNALSGKQQNATVYAEAMLNIPFGERRHLYIVAYDLLKSSGKLYEGQPGVDRNRRIQSIIANWFIAFGGCTQRNEVSFGDLGYGYFSSFAAAVQASLWAGYHLDLLKGTDPLFQQDEPHAGFGIVYDDLNSGPRDHVASEWLSRISKAWKREAERIAERSGREGRQIVAVKTDLLSGMDRLPSGWFGQDDEFDHIPVRYVRPDAMEPLPFMAPLESGRGLFAEGEMP